VEKGTNPEKKIAFILLMGRVLAVEK